MTNVRNYLYKGNLIAFDFADNAKMINATQMAKAFNKRPNDFLRLPSTKEFIIVLEQALKSDTSKSRITPKSDVQKSHITFKGNYSDSTKQGTWMHEKLALKFAAWLSPEFELWIFDKIQELLTTGKTELKPKSDEEKVLEVVNLLTNKIESQKQLLLEQKPKVEFYEEVLDSKTTYLVTQIAKELGMSAIKLNAFLRLKGVQFRRNNQWVLYAKYDDCGYIDTKTHTYIDKKGDTQTVIQTRWTNKGRQFIHNLFNNISSNSKN